MYTYQDLLEVGQSEQARMQFIRSAIENHKGTQLYRTAIVADEYDRQLNHTINQYQKLLYTVTGRVVPDNYSANWKMASNFFHRFVLQEVQFLLGNGATWKNGETIDKLGKDFDTRLQEVGKAALIAGVSFGFFNLNHLEVFEVKEFVPLYDEENGALMAGIRFWQVSDSRPLRATLYEIDGYTDYLWNDGNSIILHEKRPYIFKIRYSEVDGVEIYDGENYPTFPIVPLWGNSHHQSELIGLQEQIDCYDLIKSGFANDVDDASQIYWVIQNAGGMDDVDLAKFIERMKTVKAAVVEDGGAKAESHTIEVPYVSRETLLDRLAKDLYKDAMALDIENIASGATTATQIKAAYEPLNSKCDDFEYCIRDFIDGILTIIGVEDESPTFTRSMLVNTQEEIQTIVAAATYLDNEYVTRKILTLLGDGDQADEILNRINEEALERLSEGFEQNMGNNTSDDEEAQENVNENTEDIFGER